ncbi:LCP family protein [Streptomyces sp. NPDC059506]|uniref:LCP family protein n=1 Tax=Streptomyces TaxID=1883 RepID=UPI003681D522
MTTTADTPAPPEDSAADTEGSDDGAISGAPDGPKRPRRRRILRHVALATSLLLLASAGVAWYGFQRLDSNIRTDDATADELLRHEDDRPQQVAEAKEALNILLIGSDDRSGGNSKYGRAEGRRSDSTILLHVAADRGSATAVSIPRDLMVDIPSCTADDGTATAAQKAQFNWAFQFGGAACTILTLEQLTGIRIDDHLIVDFTGFKEMVDAVEGVEVCLTEPVTDKEAKLDLPAGRQTLYGEDALAYVRARHGFGNGSDTERMGRQQAFLASLVQKVQSNGVLLNPARLFPLASAATSSLTASGGLDSIGELYELASGLRSTPTENFVFLTVPREPYALNANRDQLVQPAADELFEALRNDEPVEVAAGKDSGEKSGKESGEGTPEAGNGSPSAGGGHVRAAGPFGSAADGPVQQAGSARTGDSASPSASASASPSASPSSSPSFDGTTAGRDVCGGK